MTALHRDVDDRVAAARAGRRGLVLALALLPPAALAQPAAPVTASGEPPSVVVTVTGVAQSGFDTPAAVDTVSGRTLRDGQRQVNLSETLARVPGLNIADRQNYAQDLQISSRGFGARSTFGVRGIRLYADGIPASMPDGSGQVSHFALSSAARVEVLRGPFSALHGNAAGGVIAITSEDPPPGMRATPSFSLGSFNTWRAGAQFAGTEGRIGYVLDASRFATDGARERSAATRELGNARLKIRLGEATTLTVTGNRVDMPASQDPLGLTRAEFNANPDQASPAAIAFNTRKSTRQVQGGAVLEHAFSAAHQLRVAVYGGDRAINQYQAIPTAAQAAATHPGGVIDLDRAFHGIDARWIHRGFAADGAYLLTAGAAREVQDELRRGFRNFIGAPATPSSVGVLGALRRDEANRVVSTSLFAQAEWQVLPALKVSAGVRHSRVAFASADRFIAAGNPDDSGAVTYRATTPAAGVVWSITGAINAYATVGRGFETPTFNELAYSPAGGSGLNFALKAATSRHAEAGLKARFDGGFANLALFRADTADEIVTASNTGGRAVFQNAGHTARKGLEAAAAWRGASGWSAYGAYTLIEAKYVDAFRTCAAAPPCAPAAAVTIPGGTDMPGIPRRSLYAELAWRAPRAFAAGTPHAALEVRTVSQVRVDDRNSDAAAAYTVAGLRVGIDKRMGDVGLSGFARIDNLANARYAGSVIVGESNGRYFEAAPGRHWTVGATLAWRIK
ncbi:MAG: TonB-dependent receptor [Burkholderiales bacterium]|nr:TonB-dependent receptor [Burkholderiales bacterium]